ncbi:MAG: hypothetical protein JXR96_30475 [Deltaproteobacteria bacterium]|nr:hypothetical protein [Deltaproteobacteria bacterium]
MSTDKLSERAVRDGFAPDAKIGLVATRDPGGLPHVTLLSSLAARSPEEIMFGQFCEGASKENVRERPELAFLVLNASRQLWRGKACWTRSTRHGEDYDFFNAKPMFRYNAYFGVHTVHYLKVLECSRMQRVGLPGLVAGSLLSLAASPLAARLVAAPALTPFSRALFASLSSLKFVSYVEQDDGFPVLLPPIACRAAGTDRLVLAPGGASRELAKVAAGSSLAVFCLNLEMQSVLVRGRFRGLRGLGPARLGLVDIDWVYNSMPPVAGPIFPRPPLHPLRDLDG